MRNTPPNGYPITRNERCISFMKTFFTKGKMSESLMIAMLLALVGGYLDIYSYLARGKVFANTQTGNLVLLGYHIAVGNMQKVVYYLLAISSFICGIWVAKIIEYKFQEGESLHWLHMILIVEIMGLFIVMFLPENTWNILANMIVSFVCALQVQGFRKVNGKAYSTIMFTGNLKNLADHFAEYYIKRDQEALDGAKIYFGVISMFVIGGWLGALTTIAYKVKAVGLVNIILGIVFILLYLEKKALGRQNS